MEGNAGDAGRLETELFQLIIPTIRLEEEAERCKKVAVPPSEAARGGRVR
jgi:hypothetical protein